MSRLHDLFDQQGQSRLDNIRRGWITSGELPAGWSGASVV